jgi:hypothetical protein
MFSCTVDAVDPDPGVTTRTPWLVAAVPKEMSAVPPEVGVARTQYSQVAPAIGYGTDCPVMAFTVVKVKSHCWRLPRGIVSAHGWTLEEFATTHRPAAGTAIMGTRP